MPETNQNAGPLGMVAAAAPIAGGLIEQGLGMATRNWSDKRQLRQQGKLQNLQIKGAKELGEFNQALAMRTWHDTNYAAQRKELIKAGLNPGLMYGQAGAGGTTQGGSAGNVASSQAYGTPPNLGMGMQLGLTAMLQQAQIENIKADTQAKLAGIPKTGAETENLQTTGQILQFEKDLKEIERNSAKWSQQDLLTTIAARRDKEIQEAITAENEAKKSGTDARVAAETADTRIQQTIKAADEQSLRIANAKMDLKKTDAEIKSIAEGVHKVRQEVNSIIQQRQIDWAKIDQAERERFVREAMVKVQQQQVEFNTSTAAQLKQWTSVITDIIGNTPAPKANRIGF